MAAYEGLGVVTYSPVGGGLLSGKYGATARPNQGRLVDNAMYGRRYSDDWGYQTAEAFTQLAQEHRAQPCFTCGRVGWRSPTGYRP